MAHLERDNGSDWSWTDGLSVTYKKKVSERLGLFNIPSYIRSLAKTEMGIWQIWHKI